MSLIMRHPSLPLGPVSVHVCRVGARWRVDLRGGMYCYLRAGSVVIYIGTSVLAPMKSGDRL